MVDQAKCSRRAILTGTIAAACGVPAAYEASYAFREKIDIDGFDDPRMVFDLTEELIRRRYSDDNIKAVLGGNFRRLLGSTWK